MVKRSIFSALVNRHTVLFRHHGRCPVQVVDYAIIVPLREHSMFLHGTLNSESCLPLTSPRAAPIRRPAVLVGNLSITAAKRISNRSTALRIVRTYRFRTSWLPMKFVARLDRLGLKATLVHSVTNQEVMRSSKGGPMGIRRSSRRMRLYSNRTNVLRLLI